MSPDTRSNAGSSAGTSPRQQKPKAASPPDSALPERDYLAREAARARSAISSALGGVTRDLGRGIDPRPWARSHPWIALAAAGGAGFVTGSSIIPTRERRVLRRIRKIEKKLEQDSPGHSDGAPQKSRGWATVIGTELFKIAQPLVLSALTAAFATHSDEPGEEEPADSPDAATGPQVPVDDGPH